MIQKIFSKVGTAENVKLLQADLHKLFHWSHVCSIKYYVAFAMLYDAKQNLANTACKCQYKCSTGAQNITKLS